MKYLIITIILILGVYFLVSRKPQESKNYDVFAKCLAEKN